MKKMGLIILILLFFTCVSVSANDLNETTIGDENSTDNMIVYDENIGELSSSNSYNIDTNNYDDFFDSEGNLISKEIKTGDIIYINGAFSTKKFTFDKSLNIIGSNNNSLNNCILTFKDDSSNSNVSNLNIKNTEDYTQGIFLNGVSNCNINGCIINNTGCSSNAILIGNNANNNTIMDNKLTCYGITYSHGTRSTSPLLISGSHNNYIANNEINADDANAIYLSSYSGGPLNGGVSNYNVIYNNTVQYNVLPTSWSYGIQLMGSYNTVNSNTVIGAYRGISSSGTGNIIINNKIKNIRGADYNDPDTPTGGEYAIVASSYSTVINNTIENAKLISTGAAISALDYSVVENNIIEVVSSSGVGIHPQGSYITIKNNTISTISGTCVFFNSYSFNLTVSNNNIASQSGIGILIQKLSSKKIPGNITIIKNNIYVDSIEHAINTQDVPDENNINVELNNVFILSNIEVNVVPIQNEISYGENATFLISTNNTDVNLLIKTTNYQYSIKIDNGTNIIEIPNLKASENPYDVEFYFNPPFGYSNSKMNFSIKVNKVNSNLILDNLNTYINHEITLISYINSTLIINEGTVIFFDGNEKIGESNVVNSIAKLNYTPTKSGEHNITASFNSDNYLSSQNSTKLFVDEVTLNILVENGIVDCESSFSTNLIGLYNKNYSGHISYIVDDEFIGNISVLNDFADIKFIPHTAGDHIIEVRYFDNYNNFISKNQSSYSVAKGNSKLSISDMVFDYGIGFTDVVLEGAIGINANIIDNVDANIRFDKNIIFISDLNVGNYTLNITTIPDSNHNPITKTVKITVNKIDSKLIVNDTSFDYNGEGSTSILFYGAKGVTAAIVELGIIIIDIEDTVIKFPSLDSGIYTLRVTTIPDDNHYSVTKDATITVNKLNSTIELTDIVFDYGHYGYSNVELYGAANFTAKIINNSDAIIHIAENKVIVSDLNSGEYTLEVTTIPDNNYNSVNTSVKIIVNKIDSKVNAKNSILKLGDITPITLSMDGAIGISSAFVLNHPETIVNFNNSEVFISNLTIGDYKLVVITIPDGNHNSVISNIDFVVEKSSVILSSSPVTTHYNSNGYLIVNLKDSSNKPIKNATLYINLYGVKYFVTDCNGQIKVSTNSLTPTIYTATITFEGNENYEKSTTTVKVTVKKATPKITAKAKTFKKKVKTKKYKITLKNNLNKVMKSTKVTIKVNKKTYTAKTNAKGVATFKIKKLTKKGTFKSTITYKGNSYYNKVTKKVKIKVK